MKTKLLLTLPVIIFPGINLCYSQDTLRRIIPPGYDPHYDKIIPDKVFEIVLPLLILFIISNTVMNVFKTRAENRLKEKALDKQISEPTLIALFSEDKSLVKYSYLKYFLILAALGTAFISVQLIANTNLLHSGFMAVGIIALYMSFALLIYYFIIRRK